MGNDYDYDSDFSLPQLARRDVLNILDFGVVPNASVSQTAAIDAAFKANPDKAFFFPPYMNWRLDSTLFVTTNNSIILGFGSRIYAGAAMDALIDWDNGAVAAANFAQDQCLVGYGMLDCAMLAQKGLIIGGILRFTLGYGLTISDPINRGIVTRPLGAEIIGHNIRLRNTTTINILDNIAIEAQMGDCQFSDIITRDFTVGIWDKGNNVWRDIHPWIGTAAQCTVRYPTSCAFILASNSILERPYADTYRYGFRSAAAAGFANTRVLAPRFFVNTGNLPGAVAAANPGAIYDLVDGGLMQTDDGALTGGATPYAFVQGATTRFNARNMIDLVPGSITGLATYRRGVQIGTTSFGATPFGSTSGGVTLTTNSCKMEVRDGVVLYTFILIGTVNVGFAGRLRIGGIPMPPGATAVSTGVGGVSYVAGPLDVQSIIGASGVAAPLVALLERMTAGTSTEPIMTALAGLPFELWGYIECPFTYPS